MHVFAKLVAGLVGLFLAFEVHSETGAPDRTIVLGQSLAMTGPLAELAKEYRSGALLYFDHINAQGGIKGRRIELVSLDDGYDPKRAAENTRRLINQDGVFAIFGQFGTGVSLETLPLATAAGVPFFAPYSGADALREGGNRYLFNIRASYGQETEKIIEHIATIGFKDIAIVYQNDAFGKAGLAGAEKALERRGLKPVAVGPIEMPGADTKVAVDALSKAKPSVVVLITAGKASVAFIRDFGKTGLPTQYYALSVVSSRQLVADLGPSAHGVAIAQVMPSPWRASLPVVHEYQQLLAKSDQAIGYASLEGFIAAKVFAEGLRRTGKELSRDALIASLEGLRGFDVGGYIVDFGPRKRNGSSYVDLSIISKTGEFLR